MSTIHLGCLDLPHPGGEKSGLTTGDLAEILESKYGLYSNFLEANEEQIADACAESVGDAIDNMLAGLTPAENPLAAAEQEIVGGFITYLDTEEIARLGVNGVPTQAALKGVNHRLKIKRGARRNSFIDTGALRISTATWVDDGATTMASAGAQEKAFSDGNT